MEIPFALKTSLPLKTQHAVERWLAAPPNSRYVFGCTKITNAILKSYEVAGVVDDFTHDRHYGSYPVVRSDQLQSNSPVLSAVIGKPASVKRVCDQRRLDHVDFFAFQKHCGNPDIRLRFWADCPADITNHAKDYLRLWKSLADEESKKVLSAVLSLRLSGDLSVMDGFTERQNEQYFEPFLGLSTDGEVFLDVGGFNGATSIEFTKHCPGYEAVHIFEPDPLNIALIKELTKSTKKIKVHPFALGPEPLTLKMTCDHSRSHISDTGEHDVFQVRLDDLNISSGSFLKMDIEGAELGAIDGAKEFIRQKQPRLAIAAYHKVDDLWRIPAAISPLMDADIYLRHYTEGLDETVMFFIPRSRKSACAS